MSCIDFGERIGDYDVYEEIGKGGFGRVDKAKCRKTNKEVAIKKMDKNYIKQKKLVKRVLEEISIHSSVDHKSIVKFYKSFQDDDYVYIVLELCKNGNLDQKVKLNGAFNEEKARNYLTQVAEGLVYLHSRSIIHRDLTLANLLLDSKGHIKIADFGLATLLDNPESKKNTMCGTPFYISPEITDRLQHGRETDMWNFGLVTYMMLVGDEKPDVILSKVKNERSKLSDKLSQSAKDLIRKCTKRIPSERISVLDILHHPFFRVSPEERGSVSCRSDSGVCTMSTNATATRHSGTPLSAVCEDAELYSGNAYHSQKYPKENKIPHSPPVKLKQNLFENGYQFAGRYKHPKKSYEGLPYTNQNDPSTEFQYDAHPIDCYYDKRVVQSSEKELSCMSGRSCGNVINDRQEEEVCGKRSYSSNSYREHGGIYHQQQQPFCVNNNAHYQDKNSHDERKSRSQKNFEGGHRRSLSSDEIIISNGNKYSYVARSSSLDRERYEEERFKSKGRTHPSNCHCSLCLSHSTQISVCSACHSNNNQRSYCKRHCETRSQLIDLGKSSKLSSRSNDLLKNIVPIKRSPTPPYETPTQQYAIPVPVSQSRSPIHPYDPPVPNTHMRPPISVSQKGSYNERTDFNNKATLSKPSSPLRSRRLRPIQHETKGIVLSILEDGEVGIEFPAKMKKGKQIIEVYRISQDGMKIIMYKRDGSSLSQNSDVPPPKQIILYYENLPQKYWKKYIYAARFVKFVKSKTPKITYYSDKAKCSLMENFPPDFAAAFFSGENLLISKNKLHITDTNGKELSFNENDCEVTLNSWFPLYQHALKIREHCLKMEQILTDLENSTGNPSFPVIIGKRTSVSSDRLGKRSEGQENISPGSVQSSRVQVAGLLESYQVSMDSVTTSDSGVYSRPRIPLTPRQDDNILPKNERSGRELFIANVGTAYMDIKKMELKYNDGTSFKVQNNNPTVFIYTDITGERHFNRNEGVPSFLTNKLRQFVEAMSQLNPNPSRSNQGGKRGTNSGLSHNAGGRINSINLKQNLLPRKIFPSSANTQMCIR